MMYTVHNRSSSSNPITFRTIFVSIPSRTRCTGAFHNTYIAYQPVMIHNIRWCRTTISRTLQPHTTTIKANLINETATYTTIQQQHRARICKRLCILLNQITYEYTVVAKYLLDKYSTNEIGEIRNQTAASLRKTYKKLLGVAVVYTRNRTHILLRLPTQIESLQYYVREYSLIRPPPTYTIVEQKILIS